MKTKTCGECEIYDHYHLLCIIGGDIKPTERAKDCFVSANPTNGDRIREGSDKELVIYKHEWSCHVCIYHDRENKRCHCRRPNDKVCMDGMIAWLNAPADCVKQNGNHDTQADLCKADNTESEGKDE